MKTKNKVQLKNIKTPASKKIRQQPFIFRFFLGEAALLFFSVLFNALRLPQVSGALLCLMVMALYYFIPFSVFINEEEKAHLKQCVTAHKKYVFAILLLFVAVSFFLISQEKFIYYWDYSGYWSRNISISAYIFSQPFTALSSVIRSINTAEYNFLLPLIMALPTRLLGDSYSVYVVLCCALFAVPAVFMIAMAVHRCCLTCGLKPLPFSIIVLMVASASCIIIPCLEGYPDAGALLYIAAVIYITMDWKWDKFHMARSNSVIALLLLILLQRRYFSFFVIGFVFAWSVQAVLSWAITPTAKQRKKVLANYSLTMAYIGSISLVLLLTAFGGFFRMSISGNYANKYSAYAILPFFKETLRVCAMYGWPAISIAVVGIILIALGDFKNKNYIHTPVVGMLFSLIIVSITAFLKVQNMGTQHQYVIAVPVIILAMLGIHVLIDLFSVKYVRYVLTALAIVLMSASFLTSTSIIKAVRSPLLPTLRYAPKIRNDIPQIIELDNRIRALTATDNSMAYILSSSHILNNDIFYKLYYPDTTRINTSIPGHAHVDLRDGFAPALLQAKYVIVCDPIQTHLKEGSQNVISIPASDILTGSGIGTHYTFLEEYQLDGNVKAKIYERTIPFSREDLIGLAERFDALYPEQPELFRDRILSAS